MPVTIKDVAARAGVSTATVSRVVNRDARITEGTRLRVLASIEQLGYKVNGIARSLKARRTLTVGFLSPEIANDFFMTVAQGVETTLRAHGYNMIVCNSNEKPEEERERLELMMEQCVDGVIIVPATNSGAHFNVVRNFQLPTVLVDRLVEDFESDAVLVDNVDGVYKAMRYLLKQGYERFGFIGGSPELSNARERYRGFVRAFEEYGLSVEERYVRFGDFHVESGYRLMGELVNLPEPPECVFISNYMMHIGAAKYLVERRGIPGRELFIASFDDMELSSITGLPSLTIAQPMSEIGHRAAELLLTRIRESQATGGAGAVAGGAAARGSAPKRESGVPERESSSTGGEGDVDLACGGTDQGAGAGHLKYPHLESPPRLLFPAIERLPTELVFHR